MKGTKRSFFSLFSSNKSIFTLCSKIISLLSRFILKKPKKSSTKSPKNGLKIKVSWRPPIKSLSSNKISDKMYFFTKSQSYSSFSSRMKEKKVY
jgi:hypothetical protein